MVNTSLGIQTPVQNANLMSFVAMDSENGYGVDNYDEPILTLQGRDNTDALNITNPQNSDSTSVSKNDIKILSSMSDVDYKYGQKFSFKNEGANLTKDFGFFKGYYVEGTIGDSKVNLKLDKNFFNPQKGHLKGKINGQKVDIEFELDQEGNVNFGDAIKNHDENMKNQLAAFLSKDNEITTISSRNYRTGVIVGTTL